MLIFKCQNLAPCIAFTKFNVKFNIALENFFYVKILNFGIGTQIWHCIENALSLENLDATMKLVIDNFIDVRPI